MTWKTRYYHLLDSLQRQKRRGGREPRERRERRPRSNQMQPQAVQPAIVRNMTEARRAADRMTRTPRPRPRIPARTR